MSLETLMSQAQNGDNKAYAELLTEISPLIENFLKGKLSNPEDVNDVTQEVLISVHKASQTYDPSRPFKVWLFAITRYRLNDFLRSVYAQKARGADIDFNDDDLEIVSENDVTNDYEDIEFFHKALGKLPEKQQKILTMLKLEGYSVRETSIAMGMKESAVKVCAHRALKQLSDRYAGK
ncbi:MAG: sigma-70 family RNA polymerase sigma factor [Pseudomonadota bacterium]